MSEYDLIGHGHVISLNTSETVGVMQTKDITDNQTRTSTFDVNYLREWLDAVEDAYGREVEITFTPNKPMMAQRRTHTEEGGELGIAIAPRISKDYDLGGDDE